MSGFSRSMAEGAAASFGQESDLVLAADAMPFALKTLDMLALQNPGDPDIQLAAARGYIQYSSAFLDWEARKRESDDYAAAEQLRQRAAQLFLRGRQYAMAALEIRHPHAGKQLKLDPESFLSGMKKSDVPALCWVGAGWAAAIAAQPSNLEEVTHLTLIEAIMRRAHALDPDYDEGALHEFFILWMGNRSPAAGGDPEAAEQFFERAITASQGRLASPYVSLATSVTIQRQDAERFRALLNQALAIDPEAAPAFRLANTLAHEKARWYLDHIEDFFLLEETP